MPIPSQDRVIERKVNATTFTSSHHLGGLIVIQEDTGGYLRLGHAECECLFHMLQDMREEAYIEKRLKATGQLRADLEKTSPIFHIDV